LFWLDGFCRFRFFGGWELIVAKLLDWDMVLGVLFDEVEWVAIHQNYPRYY
jgi:hypothetical protein